ncbi:hypothetical protein V6N11_063789 [Hibiscus sabdariffa]|uniref:Uncharacterized protein n=1 Tax=Hibiscus sabdariffa TaxID=183260 RepID=A0ABR2PLZ7_9ROSI
MGLRISVSTLLSSGFVFESNEIYFQAALKVLGVVVLLQTSNSESSGHGDMNQMQVYSTATKLCEVNQVPNIQETDLIVGHWTWSKYYHINVSGISVDGIMLDIPSDVWLYDPNGRTGGMILDTSSPLTWLVAPAYDKLI